MKKLFTTTAIALALSVSTADAASFNCGRVMCKLFGISKADCEKRGLTLALKWPEQFQRVSAPAPGVVVASTRDGKNSAGGPGGHVVKIIKLTEKPCKAVVIDNRGRPYVRNICKRLVAYVMPARAWTE